MLSQVLARRPELKAGGAGRGGRFAGSFGLGMELSRQQSAVYGAFRLVDRHVADH